MNSEVPTTVSVEDAAVLLGVSRTTAYRLAASNQFPVSVLRVGRKLRVPTALLAEALGLQRGEVIERVGLAIKERARPRACDTDEDGTDGRNSD